VRKKQRNEGKRQPIQTIKRLRNTMKEEGRGGTKNRRKGGVNEGEDGA